MQITMFCIFSLIFVVVIFHPSIFTFFSVPSWQYYSSFSVVSNIFKFVKIFVFFNIWIFVMFKFFFARSLARLFHAFVHSLTVCHQNVWIPFVQKYPPERNVHCVCGFNLLCCPFEPLLTTISSHFFLLLIQLISKYSLNVSFFLTPDPLFFLCRMNVFTRDVVFLLLLLLVGWLFLFLFCFVRFNFVAYMNNTNTNTNLYSQRGRGTHSFNGVNNENGNDVSLYNTNDELNDWRQITIIWYTHSVWSVDCVLFLFLKKKRELFFFFALCPGFCVFYL